MTGSLQDAVTDEEKLKRFWQLGYFSGHEWDEIRTFALDDTQVRFAAEQFREFHGLTPGDSIDPEVTTQLFYPRCGLPDFVQPEGAAMCKWSFLDVTCGQRIAGLQPLATEIEVAAYQQAIASWNAVCGIRLRLVSDAEFNAANIYSNTGNTSGGVLAYSYLPCGNTTPQTRLGQVYGRSINWSPNLLLQVLTHEIGHAIGLDHGPSGSLMQPTASGGITKPQAWDISQVVTRYGPRTQAPPPTPEVELFTITSSGRYALEKVVAGGEYQTIDKPGRYRLMEVTEGNDWSMF